MPNAIRSRFAAGAAIVAVVTVTATIAAAAVSPPERADEKRAAQVARRSLVLELRRTRADLTRARAAARRYRAAGLDLQARLRRRVIAVRDLEAALRRSSVIVNDAPTAIRLVFGDRAGEALRVAWCESRYHTWARNGQYLGIFQMGTTERATYGHGPTALDQAVAAHRYFLAANGWGPWECKP